MGASEFTSLPPAGIAVIAVLFISFAATAGMIVFGLVQRSMKTGHRVGEDWGGEYARVVEWSNGAGYVRIGGEIWKAASPDLLAPGDDVTVARTEGLLLEVRKK